MSSLAKVVLGVDISSLAKVVLGVDMSSLAQVVLGVDMSSLAKVVLGVDMSSLAKVVLGVDMSSLAKVGWRCSSGIREAGRELRGHRPAALAGRLTLARRRLVAGVLVAPLARREHVLVGAVLTGAAR